MTVGRVAEGGATAPAPRDGRIGARRSISRAGIRLAVAVVATAVAVAACTSGTASPTAPVSSAAAQSAGSDAGLTPLPSGTPWPGNVPDAVIALGAFDDQMAAAAQAMDAAVTAKDPKALSGAAKGLVDLVDGNAGNVKTVQGYAGTKQLGDGYAEALSTIRAGAQAIVDGTTKGDAKAVDAGITVLGQGITLYGLARKALGPMLEQAISMKRMYVK